MSGSFVQRPASPKEEIDHGLETCQQRQVDEVCFDADFEEAARLLSQQGIPLQDHRLMQENLACYLANQHNYPSARWQVKIDRDLADAYTDDQVFEQIGELQTSVKATFDQLPAYPTKVYVTGSFARGRVGKNSDLDGYAVFDPAARDFDLSSLDQAATHPDGVSLLPVFSDSPGYLQGLLLASGASVEMDPGRLQELDYLGKLYQDVLKEKGPDRVETSAVFEWFTGKVWSEDLTAEQKREELEGWSLKSLLTNWTLSLGGTLSTLPLVGPLVRQTADLFVDQDHHRSQEQSS